LDNIQTATNVNDLRDIAYVLREYIATRIIIVMPTVLSHNILWLQMGFGPQNGVVHLKMIDAGLPRDKFVLFTVPALPFQILLSIMLRSSLTGPRSMHTFVKYNLLM
jgi:hypothetical protein